MDLLYTIDFYDNVALVIPDLKDYPLSNEPYLLDEPFLNILNNFLYNHPNVCENINMTSFLPIEDRIITLDLINMDLKTPYGYIDYIIDICSVSSQLVVLPIRIKSYDIVHTTKNIVYHSNLIIIDNTNMTIEYFEPHGFNYQNSFDFISLPNIFKEYLLSFTNLFHYTFINSTDSCNLGVQSMQTLANTTDGHCLAWSLYFIILRVLNCHLQKPFISQYLHSYMTNKFTPLELDTLIKKFLSFIHTKDNNLNKLLSNYNHTSIVPYILLDPYNNDKLYTRIKFLAKSYYDILLGIKNDANIDSIFNELVIYKDINNFQKIMKDTLLNIN